MNDNDYANRMADAEYAFWMSQEDEHDAHVQAWITHLLLTKQL